MNFVPALQERLLKRQAQGSKRYLHTAEGLIDFASNDYLGLSRSAILSAAVSEELEIFRLHTGLNGLGSTGSRLLTGNSQYAEDLEESIARYHGFEAGLFFNCGYMANLGLISSIVNPTDIIIYDSYAHMSTCDGIRLSKARAYAFQHNDMSHLEKLLETVTSKGKRIVCVESIYSVDGSQSPLEELCSLCERYGAYLIVDEAHAIGVLGSQGRGVVFEKKLNQHVFAQVVTFGKALGCQGAIILGSKQLKEYLINFSRPCIYTTALPPYALATIKCAYQLLPELEKERSHIQKLSQLLCREATGSFGPHIHAIKIQGNAEVRHQAKRLAQAGFDIRPLMFPSVSRGNECLRVCLHAFNTESELQTLVDLIFNT